nr:MAG TPA: hypothetical protein [Caudoviricetes sp.]
MGKRLIHYIFRSFLYGFSVRLVCALGHQKYSKGGKNTRN